MGRVHYKHGDPSVQASASVSELTLSDDNEPLTLVISTHEYKTQKPHNPNILLNNWTHSQSGVGQANSNVAEGIKVYGEQTSEFNSYYLDKIIATSSGRNMTRLLWYVIDPDGEIENNSTVHIDIGLQQPSAYAVL